MPEVTRHEPGTACWLDLASPDPETSKAFYGELLGWHSYTLSVDKLDDYEMFTLGGVDGPTVAGMQTLADETQPPSWTCYFRVTDVTDVARRVLAAGGRELVAPLDIAHLGRIGMYLDPQGTDFAVWEPYEVEGAQVVGEPSAMCWVELASREVEKSRRFYGEVFGWRAVDRHYYRHFVYTNWKIDGWSVAGMVHMDETWPDEWPGDWIPYFQVADCDAVVARSVELGASVVIQPDDIDPGRFGVVMDPTGARLGLLAPRAR
ncbi:VOC family protein [Actinomadura algeriensis]|uniref:Enzyme related to lactoylglutathione lyase n=1 Tax=Actinomadura algeriensis TaxID=1679523 RepID=A0ABR9JKA8_9ACTN|nr:VOC family protein [Actinomadura algeriensis]MBE1530868.1 putative enzyme related to lactoylglutathione lyase [Actinomadura algeriensis]